MGYFYGFKALQMIRQEVKKIYDQEMTLGENKGILFSLFSLFFILNFGKANKMNTWVSVDCLSANLLIRSTKLSFPSMFGFLYVN